nr:Ig-like domain-containing protein [Granulicella sibirica]
MAGPVTVNGPSTLTATLNIDADADLGPRDVTVTTGGEVETVPAGFTVQPTTVSPPTVLFSSPAYYEGGVPINTKITAVFSQPMDRTSFTATDVNVYLESSVQGQISVSGSISLDASGRVLTFIPTVPLAVGSSYELYLTSAITDASGNALDAYATLFSTGFTASTTAPQVVAVNPIADIKNVGTNATIQVEFNTPMDQSTQTGLTVSDGVNSIPGSYSWNTNTNCFYGYSFYYSYQCTAGTIVTFTPSQPLAPNQAYTVNYGAPLADAAGNVLGTGSFAYTTGAGPDTTNGSSGVSFGYFQPDMSTNFTPQVNFSKPVNRIDVNASNLFLYDYDSGKYLRGTVNVAADGLSATFVPAMPLLPDTAYAFAFSGGTFDMDGNTLYGNYAYFITGASSDSTPPQVASVSPSDGTSTVPLNAQVAIHFNEPVDPDFPGTMTVTPDGGVPIPGTATLSSDQLTLTFLPTNSLKGMTKYTVALTGYQDFAGNVGVNFNSQFTTTTTVTPISLSTGFLASGMLSTTDNTSDANWVVTVGSNAPVAAKIDGPGDGDWSTSYASNGPNSSWITLNPDSPAGNTAGVFSRTFNLTGYNLSNLCLVGSMAVDITGGLQLNGTPITQPIDTYSLVPLNVALPVASLNAGVNTLSMVYSTTNDNIDAFRLEATVQTCGVSFTSGLQLVRSTPAIQATGVATSTSITLTFNHPLDPATVNANTIQVLNTGASYSQIAGSYKVNGSQVIYTPDSPFPANTQINVNSYGGPVDTAGESLGNVNTLLYFTTNATSIAPSAPFAVTAFSPAPDSTNIGLHAPVVATFNRSFNPQTINPTSSGTDFALYAGDNLNCTNYMKSQDNTTLQFNCYPLPASTAMTALIKSNLQDMSGQGVANFSSKFTTAPVDSNTHGTIVTARPGSGATSVPANSPLVLFTSLPISTSSANAALKVSQNGVLIPGAIQVLDSGYTLQFTPSSPYVAGALIQWTVTADLVDATYGSSFTATGGYFTVAADTSMTIPTLQAAYPAAGGGTVPNSIFELQFSAPIDPGTVNATNIYLTYQGNGGSNLAATLSQPQPNTIRIIPQSDLTGSPVYLVIESGLRSTTSVPAQQTEYYFFPTGADDTTVPTIVSAVPYNGAINIGVNATPGIVFSKAIDPASINNNTFKVANGGASLPGGYMISTDNTRVQFVPSSPLPVNADLTMTLEGVLDGEGHAASFSSHFKTASGPDFTPPTIVYSSVGDGETVPVNATVTVQFSESMDITTLNTRNIDIYDYLLGTYVPATLTFSADQSVAYLVPNAPLAAGRQYVLQVYSGMDLAGNQLQGNSFSFTAGLAAASSAPTLQYLNPLRGATGVGVNVLIEAQFTGGIDPNTLSGVELLAGVNSVPITTTTSNGNTILQLTPQTPLTPNTTYQVRIAGVKDPAGNTLSTVTNSFTTGATFDLAGPQVVAYDPPNGAEVGTNISPKFYFNKPLNPITVTTSSFRMYRDDTGQNIPISVIPATNGLSVTLEPLHAIAPNGQYEFAAGYGFQDANGNNGNGLTIYFSTGAGTNTTGPSITVSPGAGATGIPLDTHVVATSSAPIDPTSWTQSSIQVLDNLSQAVAGTIGLTDTQTLTFVPTNPLSQNVTYTVKAGGFNDANGNPATLSNTNFRTGTSAGTDGLTLASTNIPSGAANVANTQAIILTFSQILNPASVNDSTLRVLNTYNGSLGLAGTYLVSGNQVTFTPVAPYPAGAQIYVVSCGGPSDVQGDVFLNGSCYSQLLSFTVSSASPDTTPLKVVSINPAANATGVPLTTQVSVTFNKSINPSSVSYGGSSALLSAGQSIQNYGSVSFSPDNLTVTFNTGALYGSTKYTVTLPAGGITDMSGNGLATTFDSTFQTMSATSNATGYVTTTAPSSVGNVPSDSLLTLFVNEMVDPSTVQGNLVVTVNGEVYPGTVQAVASGYEVQYTPQVPFPAGAVVQWFFSNVYDTNGNAIQARSGYFYVQAVPDPMGAPIIVAGSPASSSTNVPTNAVFDEQYSLPIDASTLSSASFYSYYGAIPALNVTLLSPAVVRIAPATPLLPSTAYYVCQSGSIKGTNGVTAQGTCINFTTTAGPDTSQGAVKIGPPNGSKNVGTNGMVRLVFSKPVDATTVTTDTVKVMHGSVSIPGTLTLSSDYGTSGYDFIGATFTPVNPLPPSTTLQVSVDGVEDYAGNALAKASSQFTTAPAPDFSAANVTLDFGYGTTDIGTNATFSCRYSKPVDPSSVSADQTYVSLTGTNARVPSTFLFSSDMESVTIKPVSALTADTSYGYQCVGALDLTGNNTYTGYVQFTTGSGPSSTGPTLLRTNPPSGATNVPLNTGEGPFNATSLGLLFDKPLSENSLSNVTLKPQGGNPLYIATGQNIGDTEVSVFLANTLQPNTQYTYSITGVTDYSGNPIALVTSTFTTGSGVDFVSPTVAGFIPADATTGVSMGTPLKVTFSEPMNPVLIDSNHVVLLNHNTQAVIPTTLSISTDNTTVSLTPVSPLAAGTIYDFEVVNPNWYLTDIAGNHLNTYEAIATFTTGP